MHCYQSVDQPPHVPDSGPSLCDTSKANVLERMRMWPESDGKPSTASTWQCHAQFACQRGASVGPYAGKKVDPLYATLN